MANPAIYRPDPWPRQPIVNAPIPPQGQQPPNGPTQLAVCLQIIRQAWEPPPPQPYQLPLTIAPLTLKYGQQPPQQRFPQEIVSAWQPQWYAWQGTPPNAAWNIPPIIISFVPYAPLQGQILTAWRPPDPWPWQRLPTVPIPAQGQQPPAVQLPNPILAAWQPPWYSFQTAQPSAAWNVPPVLVSLPYAPLPQQILTAWLAPWYPAQTQKPTTPLQLPTGQQPPPYAPLPQQVLAAWPQPAWPAQTAPPSAGWNIPVAFVASMQLPQQILTAWAAPWYPAQSAAPVAPLTLRYGQQPPPLPTLLVQAIPRAWQPPDPQPRQQPPVQLITGISPPPPALVGEIIVDTLAFVTIQDGLSFSVIADNLTFVNIQDTIGFT